MLPTRNPFGSSKTTDLGENPFREEVTFSSAMRQREDSDQMLSQAWPEIALGVYDSPVFLESD
jgi:hypothetical protein